MSESSPPSYTLSELEERSGVAARNIRFYTGREMLPPPRREGRMALYGPEHLVRLELIRELQAHGFTLAAISTYLERVPQDGSPDVIRLHRTLMAPWMANRPELLTQAELFERAGRELSPDDIDVLQAIGILHAISADTFEVAPALLSLGIDFLELGLPRSAALRARDSIQHHAHALADELTEIFRDEVWPAYKSAGLDSAQVREAVERFRPITVQGFVAAYEASVDEEKRSTISRRTASPERREKGKK